MRFIRAFAFALSSVLLFCGSLSAEPPPNIVFIIADDLGYGDLGCYGQTKIKTPHIDRLAREGMRFTSHYSGSNVCAPSRCVLMTGLHPGHAYIRDNRQAKGFPEGQEPVPESELRLPLLLKQVGYVVGGFGKWGLGPVGSTGDPLKQGFDRWFGYNCQAVAHNFYPTHLWDNDKPIALRNSPFSAYQKLPAGADPASPASYASYSGVDYAPDLIAEQARAFLIENRERPFFLYYPTTVPHLALQVPEDSLAEYADAFPETPYVGDNGYLPHRQPRAAYAAMITRMDREIGRLLDLLDEFDLAEKTIVVFTSDNGPLYDKHGGTDCEFFNSAAGLRGRKGSFFEGGFRVPCIVRWPGRVAAGAESDRITGFEDWLPTLLALVGAEDALSGRVDGVSFAPTLFGDEQAPRAFLYREAAGYGGQQCVRVGDWKALRQKLNAGDPSGSALQLYNLAADRGETTDIAAQHPEIAARLSQIMTEQHTPSKLFPIQALDDAKR
jgi:arylsulfatase A-like enzyme